MNVRTTSQTVCIHPIQCQWDDLCSDRIKSKKSGQWKRISQEFVQTCLASWWGNELKIKIEGWDFSPNRSAISTVISCPNIMLALEFRVQPTYFKTFSYRNNPLEEGMYMYMCVYCLLCIYHVYLVYFKKGQGCCK